MAPAGMARATVGAVPGPRQRGLRRRAPVGALCLLAAAGLAAAACWRPASAPAGAAFTFGAGPSQPPRSSRSARRAEEESAGSTPQTGAGKRLLVLGGGGYVGSQVCRLAVDRGYAVTSLSRRGENPDPDDARLAAVSWVKGNAADEETVKALVAESDAVVHAIGLLFDVNSGLTNLNIIVSGSGSVPGEESTYDTVTRRTAFNVISAVKNKLRLPFTDNKPTPVLFVSAAEAGWPEVPLGDQVEKIAPEWLQRYLLAKRAVEAEIASSPETIRPVIYRPSLIWSWDKLDVLPAIPVFNALSALGVPFVDKTVTVTTLSKAIIAGLEDEGVSGVQRVDKMEALEKRLG